MTETNKVAAPRLSRDKARFGAVAIRRRRMKFNAGDGVALLALATIFIGLFSLFTVPQTSQALIVRLGDPVHAISEPGLHMKMPFVDTVIYVDNRVLDRSFAQTSLAAELTGCVVAAIPPVAFNSLLKLVVDKQFLERESEIAFNAGRLDRSIVIASADYARIVRPTAASIALS